MLNSLNWFLTDRNKDDYENNNNELFETIQMYTKMFHHAVPREMIPDGITDEQLIYAIQKCIDSNEDVLLQDLGVQFEKDHLY